MNYEFSIFKRYLGILTKVGYRSKLLIVPTTYTVCKGYLQPGMFRIVFFLFLQFIFTEHIPQ